MNTIPNNILIFSSSLIFILICAGYFFLYQHLKRSAQRKTITLAPVLSTAPLRNKIFDLSKEKPMVADFYFALGTTIFISLILTVCVGGLIIEYFITKAHLMGLELLIFLVLVAVLIFIGSLILIAKQVVRPLLQMIALCALAREKEIIFDQNKVLFSIGLVHGPANDLIKEGHPYIEIPYALVKEIQILPAFSISSSSSSGGRSIPERLNFVFQNGAEFPKIKTFPFGKHKDAIIEELRKHISGPILNQHNSH